MLSGFSNYLPLSVSEHHVVYLKYMQIFITKQLKLSLKPKAKQFKLKLSLLSSSCYLFRLLLPGGTFVGKM